MLEKCGQMTEGMIRFLFRGGRIYPFGIDAFVQGCL